jgi:hypothetical protein
MFWCLAVYQHLLAEAARLPEASSTQKRSEALKSFLLN